eukprot:7641240-Pyramimonas_sp.AAC.1
MRGGRGTSSEQGGGGPEGEEEEEEEEGLGGLGGSREELILNVMCADSAGSNLKMIAYVGLNSGPGLCTFGVRCS